ncbi:MAG: glycosyltransferase family 4 protein [Sulfurimicrobium sp.]|nr:glycosyltransferase family 4 protein [Sulfurimicrobium sp.]
MEKPVIQAMTEPLRKRILYVENGIGYGGAIICLRHLLRNLDRNKFEPMVITGLGDQQYREIANEAIWKHIPDRRLDVVSMKRSLEAVKWPNALPGLRWIINQLLSRLDDLFNFLPAFVQTVWTTIRFKPDLIHVNNEPLCNRAAILAGKLLGVPVLAHVRGDQQGSKLMHLFFKLPDYFVAVSRWVSDSIGLLGVPAEKRTFIYDGIEIHKLNMAADGQAFRRQHQIPADAFVVGLVGMLIPWKGQMLIIEAAKQLLQEMPDAVFALVGGTPDECRAYEAELRKIVEQSGLKGRVVFTGHVSDMAAVYNGLDIVVSASTSPEPLGVMVMEAMTLARPLVAPDHGGAVEVIENGRTGLLFKPGNTSDLAEKIRILYRDTDMRKDIGQSARDYALRTFSMAEHVRHVEDVYKQLLKMP